MPKIIAGKREIECNLIIFDRNGTLVDQERFLLSLAKARLESLSEIVGACVTDHWEKAVGISLKRGHIDKDGPLATAPQREEALAAASVVYQHGHSWSEAKRLAQDAYDKADESLKPSYGCVLLEGTEATLKELKSIGLKLAIATTDSHKRTVESLEALGVRSLFDVIIGGDDVENPKPAPDMVLEACRWAGHPPSEAVVVGDSVSDMVMGKNAKVNKCIGVLTGFASKEQLQQSADVVIESVNQLRARSV